MVCESDWVLYKNELKFGVWDALQYALWQKKLKSVLTISLGSDDNGYLVIDRYTIPIVKHTRLQIQQKIPCPRRAGFCVNLTEEFIFICGGYIYSPYNYLLKHSRQTLDSIIIYDINKMELFQSKVKCPFKGPMKAICMRDKIKENLIVFGFINQLFQNHQWNDIIQLPFYLKQFIQSFFIVEYLHILALSMNEQIGKHFKINVDHLFS